MNDPAYCSCAAIGRLPEWIGSIDNEVTVEGIPLLGIAKRFSTPSYIYCASQIQANMDRFKRAFVGLPVSFFYAAKANSNGATLHVVHRVLSVLKTDTTATRCDVVGPICESSDYLARNCQLGDVAQGDLLAVLDCGAYGFSMASQYNSHLRLAEVMLIDNEGDLIRQRESWEDLVHGEHIPTPLVQSERVWIQG